MLLRQGEPQADNHPGGQAEQGDEPSFQHKGAADGFFLCAQRPEGADVFFLFNHQHGKAAENIEGDDNDDEEQDQEDGRFLVTHHLIQGRILSQAVQYPESRPKDVLKVALDLLQTGRVGQADFQGANFAGGPQQFVHHLDGQDDQFLIDCGIDAEQTGRTEPDRVERGGGIGNGKVAVAGWIIKFHEGYEARADAHLPGQARPDSRPGFFIAVQLEGALLDMFADGRLFLIDPVHTFRTDDPLVTVVREEDFLFQNVANRSDIRMGRHPVEGGAVGNEDLAAFRNNEQVGLYAVQRVVNQGVKAVVNGQDEDERRRSNGHTDCTDRRNDVDDIVRFLGKQVTPGYEQRQVHRLFFQQFLDVLGIVQAGVQEKHDFRDDAELLAYDAAEFPAVTAQVLVQNSHDSVCLGGREDAYVGLGDGQVGTDANLADRDHGTAEGRHPLAAEDFGQVLLDFAGYLKLTGGGCLFHYFTLMIK